MLFYKCRCGDVSMWTTTGIARCESCPRCGSDLARSEGEHREPMPHEYVKRYEEQTGERYEVCLNCRRRRSGVEAHAAYVSGQPAGGAP